MRLLLLFLLLSLVFLIPFVLWGPTFETSFSPEGARAWLEGHGDWAWAAALLLLTLDLVLPVPATAVLAALGYVYGALLGGLVGATGSILAGTLAYVLCRFLGRGVAMRIAGRRQLEEGERFFAAAGGWAVALSRWLPLLPEVISCLAGLARMRASAYFLALACGSLPMAFTFSTIGALGVDSPTLALVLSAVVPVVLWPLARRLLQWRTTPEGPPPDRPDGTARGVGSG